MNFSQLYKYIETLSASQLEMPVVVLINDNYHELSAALHVDKDFRSEEEELDFTSYPEDQPILT